MKPKEVYALRPEYQATHYDKFGQRLNDLRKKYKELGKLAEDDAAALDHDLALNLQVNNKPYLQWQGSEAEWLLKQDLDNGCHLLMPLRELKETCPAYTPYPGCVFKDHIQQELRAQKERPYWLAHWKEKEEEKRKKNLKKKKKTSNKV